MTRYRNLEKGEIVQEGDEVDACGNPWRDNPVWKPVTQWNIPAPDPQYVSHRQYRRRIDE